MRAAEATIVFVALLASSIWVGGFVAVVVVARVTARQLEPASRVDFFRDFGRVWGIVSAIALALAIGAGAALLARREWDAVATVTVVVTFGLVLATVAGVLQAKWMTRAREHHLATGGKQPSAEVLRGARVAARLRAAIGLLTLAALVGAAVLATG